MFYYFNEAENDKKTVKLTRCHKCPGECYCATIDLEYNQSLHFGFFDEASNYELNGEKAFKLDIAPDPISNIMQRYGFEQNPNLPTCENNKDKVYVFENLLNVIKNFFNSLFKKNELTSEK